MTGIPFAAYRPDEFLGELARPAARARIAAAAPELPAERACALARDHARVIAADFSYPVARRADRLLSWAFGRMFAGIEMRGLEALRRIPADAAVVYLPCHRSHADYLLVSHVLYRAGLVPPYIAAGDNMNLPLLGRLFRHGGGFFIRRSFRGDALYTAVLALYLEGLLARGLPIEFFIEGGRSRTGLMLAPRTGLLGMLVRAWVSRPERPLILVPIYLGYEKLPEGRSFLAELAGQPKRRESLGDLFGVLRVLRGNYGHAWVSGGEPLVVGDWLATHLPDWRHAADDALRNAVSALADETVRRIQAAAPVNAVNLVALALLVEPDAALPRAELERRIAALQARAPELCAAPPPAECVAQALALGAVVERDGAIAAPGELAALLAYFRNNVLHHFPLPEAAWKKSG